MKIKALEKILKPPHIVFEETKHTYTAPNGDLYTGCTTISEAWRKDFLAPWYAKEMFLEASRRIGEIGLALKDAAKPDAAIKILEECKGAAARKSAQARDDGKEAHEAMEHMVCAKIGGKKTFKAKKLTTKESQNAVDAFVQWVKHNKVEWLASEEVVANHEHKVAGTLDAIAVVDGITYLVDFKTSSQISQSYLLQCAGYDVMLREMGLNVMGYLILRLPKDGSPAETLTITSQEDMQFFRETFIKMREAHRFFVYMESKFKDVATRRMKVDEKVVIKKTTHGKSKTK